ncbi:M48 family metallopeptidase [Schlesneria paludicola]|uniref:M48 family metallopeptidase n=1 Tax=Schlesneria paludicola TaxID=360056 RepID=UPI00029AD778|nr:M48 family metallopeptidase [Schlesneria paludicola]
MNEPASQQRQILNAISGAVPLPAVSWKYTVGLLFTTAAILLVPLCYLLSVTLVIGCLVAFFLHLKWFLAGWTLVPRILVIGSVITVGASCLLGLIKPLFARMIIVQRPRTLRRNTEPFLYEYIDQLCDAVGTSRPTHIYVTCDLNAAAEFRRGWMGVFGRQDLSLYLGLPLVAGLTLRQFTGVLAHELGHFTQRAAMSLEYIVRRTNHWFAHAAHERDAVDVWLMVQCQNRGMLAPPCWFARGVVWITRRVLLCLSYAGNVIGCLMSREMEFSADRCEVRTVGATTLASTLRRLRELRLAHQTSLRDIAAFLEEGRLPDNLIALVIANTAFVSPKLKKKLRRLMDQEKTGIFDTHPSDIDRIQAGACDASPGMFQPGKLPPNLLATALFNRFEEISKTLTIEFYEGILNQPIKARDLHPVEKLMERQSEQIRAAKALRRYFQADIPRLRPLPLASQAADKPAHPREVANELKATRERMLSELTAYKDVTPRYQMAEETYFETISAQTLLQAGLPLNPHDYRLAKATLECAAAKQTRSREGIANLAAKLLPFETEAGNRLSFALQLLHLPNVARNIDDGDDLQYEVQTLLPEAALISHLMGELPSLRIVFMRLSTLCDAMKNAPANSGVNESIAQHVSTLRSRLVSIRKEMGGHLYPFDHAQAETTLQEYALPRIPAENELTELISVADALQSRLVTIQLRLFARLAQAAEKVEAVLGMPQLPEPDDDAAGEDFA